MQEVDSNPAFGIAVLAGSRLHRMQERLKIILGNAREHGDE
jgi:hypothetical protein